MHYARLGTSGPSVSRVAFGTDVNIPPQRLLGILRSGIELGINFVDTDINYVYRNPEGGKVRMWEAVRDCLREVNREDVVIVSKTLQKSARGARREIVEALEGMGLDYIDVFMLHAVDTPEQLKDMRPALKQILRSRDEGLVRQVGLSTHTVTMAREAAKHTELEVLLVTLNFAGKIMKRSGTAEQMQQAMRTLFEQGRGVYIMKSLANGRVFQEVGNAGRPVGAFGRTELERAFGYVFRCPWAHAVAIGMKSVEEMRTDVSIEKRIDAEEGIWPTCSQRPRLL
jgi:aryl-alcohol dehydrogenase-like predicted oxidoreductase